MGTLFTTFSQPRQTLHRADLHLGEAQCNFTLVAVIGFRAWQNQIEGGVTTL